MSVDAVRGTSAGSPLAAKSAQSKAAPCRMTNVDLEINEDNP
jgi:hypothetical protein